MFEQSVDQVLKLCKWKQCATANGWEVDKAARIQNDFWKQIEGYFPKENDLVAYYPAPVTRKDLLTLQHGKWVSDAVMAYCTGLASMSSKDKLRARTPLVGGLSAPRCQPHFFRLRSDTLRVKLSNYVSD